MARLPTDRALKELKDFTDALAREIAPSKRGQFIRVWQSINWIYREKSEEGIVPENDDGTYKLSIIRINLSHFERYLRVFDRQAALAFESRAKSDVDHRGTAAQLGPIVERAERGEVLFAPATDGKKELPPRT
jgi:hypothetical protein